MFWEKLTPQELGIEVLFQGIPILAILFLVWRRIWKQLRSHSSNNGISPDDPSLKAAAWRKTLTQDNIKYAVKQSASYHHNVLSFICGILMVLVTSGIVFVLLDTGGELDEGFWICLGLDAVGCWLTYISFKDFHAAWAQRRRD